MGEIPVSHNGFISLLSSFHHQAYLLHGYHFLCPTSHPYWAKFPPSFWKNYTLLFPLHFIIMLSTYKLAFPEIKGLQSLNLHPLPPTQHSNLSQLSAVPPFSRVEPPQCTSDPKLWTLFTLLCHLDYQRRSRKFLLKKAEPSFYMLKRVSKRGPFEASPRMSSSVAQTESHTGEPAVISGIKVYTLRTD